METEIKLRLPGEWAVKAIQEDGRVKKYCGSAVFSDTDMNSVYCDTEKGELARKKISLRLRRENGVGMASCKTARSCVNGLTVRGEWEVCAEDWETALPLLVSAGAPPLLADLSGPPLLCAALRFTRRAAPMTLPDGSTVELALDSGFFISGEKRTPFLELELELLSGEPGEMSALAAYLEERYSLVPEPLSKYARARSFAVYGE